MNGASGIIPAVLSWYDKFVWKLDSASVIRFFLTAGAIALLFKQNASILGSEVGCQGEIGVASSMAAAGLAELMGASVAQVLNAAEITMEHHLGLTCDPVGGQVRISCVERNAISSVKAINAATMAMSRVSEPCVSLDEVIAAMYETGKDMSAKYRETYHAALGKFSQKIGGGGMKYHTMNNDEIILSLCARIRETRISLALTQDGCRPRAGGHCDH